MRTKIVISILLIISVLAVSVPFVSAATGTPTIQIGSGSAAPGETVDIPVDFLNNPGINNFSLTIEYDSSRLQLDGVTVNPAIGGNFSYTRRAVWMSLNDIAYSGTFLTLSFTVLNNASGGNAAVTVSYTPGEIYNFNEDDVNFEVVPGAVEVIGVASPQIVVGNAAADPGDTVQIPVDFLDNPGINTYSLTIDYDETRLSLEEVTSNPQLGGQFVYVNRAAWLASDDTTYSGTYLTLNFRVLQNAPAGDAYVTVSYTTGDICNYNENDVAFEVVPGSITVNEGDPAEIVVGTGQAAPGETVSIPVDFLNNPGINTYSLTVIFDDTKLSLESVTSNPDLGGQFVYVNRAAWLASADTTYSGTFLTLNFRVENDAAAGDTAVAVSYQLGDICNYDEQDVNFTVTAGKVTITNRVLIGDVNGDGIINVKDLNVFKKYFSGMLDASEIVLANCDVDGNGIINVKDVAALKVLLASA